MGDLLKKITNGISSFGLSGNKAQSTARSQTSSVVTADLVAKKKGTFTTFKPWTGSSTPERNQHSISVPGNYPIIPEISTFAQVMNENSFQFSYFHTLYFIPKEIQDRNKSNSEGKYDEKGMQKQLYIPAYIDKQSKHTFNTNKHITIYKIVYTLGAGINYYYDVDIGGKVAPFMPEKWDKLYMDESGQKHFNHNFDEYARNAGLLKNGRMPIFIKQESSTKVPLPENSGKVGTGAQAVIDAKLHDAPANTHLLEMRTNALSNKAGNNFSNGLGIDRRVHEERSSENLARTMLYLQNENLLRKQELDRRLAQMAGTNKKNNNKRLTKYSKSKRKVSSVNKKDVLDKERNVYKFIGDRKQYIKYKNEYVLLKKYKELQKN
tara:strand:- start:7069 stop:8205 length:1137 start_codon:yes stop_codon:yes gene_type:complete